MNHAELKELQEWRRQFTVAKRGQLHPMTPEEAGRNYHAIAAALLTLAESAGNVLEAFQQHRPGAGYALQQDINAAVAAIAKAEGGA